MPSDAAGRARARLLAPAAAIRSRPSFVVACPPFLRAPYPRQSSFARRRRRQQQPACSIPSKTLLRRPEGVPYSLLWSAEKGQQMGRVDRHDVGGANSSGVV